MNLDSKNFRRLNKLLFPFFLKLVRALGHSNKELCTPLPSLFAIPVKLEITPGEGSGNFICVRNGGR